MRDPEWMAGDPIAQDEEEETSERDIFDRADDAYDRLMDK